MINKFQGSQFCNCLKMPFKPLLFGPSIPSLGNWRKIFTFQDIIQAESNIFTNSETLEGALVSKNGEFK